MSNGEPRLALALAGQRAAAPPGVDPATFALAALADTYELLSELSGVTAGIAAGSDLGSGYDEASIMDLLWPGSVYVPGTAVSEVLAWVGSAGAAYGSVVLVPADVPDLPLLVLAKVFQALGRAEVAIAPQQGGSGCAAFGFRCPPAPFLDAAAVDLDRDPYEQLASVAPRRNLVVRTPGWHRLRAPGDIDRLDPGLEGWEQTRAVLTGR